MSEKFEVPEPSREAVDAGVRDWRWTPADGSHRANVRNQLRAAFAVDMPGIVRSEVERALYARQENPLGFGIAAYLAARFPEAAPETPSEPCGKPGCTDPRCQPTTSAPETATADLARIGTDFDVAAAMKASRQFAAERDFLREMAKQQLHEYGWISASEGVDPDYEMLKAAKRVVEAR